MVRAATLAAAVVSCCVLLTRADAATTVFFDSSQIATLVSSGVTSDTITSWGYKFTYTRDKLFTGGTGQIIGRQERIPWPQGVEAQAVTTPPPGVTDYKARITIQRVDGAVFDFTAFTAKLLASTAGAGGAIEIMPLVNGEDAFNDPVMFDVTGNYGQTFHYDTSPNPWGSTVLLTGYDTYKLNLYVDFALVALTFDSAVVPGDFNGDGNVDGVDHTAFAGCYTGPGAGPFGAGCLPGDFDSDGDIDCDDWAAFVNAWTDQPPPPDLPACLPPPVPSTSAGSVLVLVALLAGAGVVVMTTRFRRRPA